MCLALTPDPDACMRRALPLAFLLLLSCGTTVPEREYGFVHLETTGLTSGLIVPGASRPANAFAGYPDVMIVFSPDSDREAVDALEQLAAEVLIPNARGAGLVVVGTLNPTPCQTQTGPGRPEAETYREFRLSRWFLRAPFLRQRRQGLGEPPAVELIDRLRPEDFGGRVGGDLSRFVRPR
jgi:hypothetical protein